MNDADRISSAAGRLNLIKEKNQVSDYFNKKK